MKSYRYLIMQADWRNEFEDLLFKANVKKYTVHPHGCAYVLCYKVKCQDILKVAQFIFRGDSSLSEKDKATYLYWMIRDVLDPIKPL